MNQQGFWRGNKWGMLALIPIAAVFGAVALDRTGFFTEQLGGRPSKAISAQPADWVAYSGAQIRLIGLSPTADLYDASAKSVKLPAELKAWKAILEFQVDDQRKLTGCQISMEDRAGRVFGTQPDELAAVKMPVPACTAEDPVLNTYQVTVLFIAPADAEPVAVRVIRDAALPGYARLVAA